MKGILKKSLALFFRPYFYFYVSWPIWFLLLNRQGRRLYQKTSRPTAEIEARLPRELKKNGIAAVHIDELFPEKNLFPVLRQYADTLLPLARTREGKPFLKALWADDHMLDLSNPFMRLALSEPVLAVVNGYMGMYSKFFYSSLDLTLPVGENSSRVRSQNWHRDPEDLKMCKMFLYLTDVDESAGPFTYIASSQYGGRWNTIAPQKPPKGSYPPDGLVESRVLPADIKACTGRAGTIVFADTAGLHRGGYAKTKERLMFTAEYSSKASLRPIRYRYPENFEMDSLNTMARFAVENNFGLLRPLNTISDFCLKYGFY